jgi:hypothetical protein
LYKISKQLSIVAFNHFVKSYIGFFMDEIVYLPPRQYNIAVLCRRTMTIRSGCYVNRPSSLFFKKLALCSDQETSVALIWTAGATLVGNTDEAVGSQSLQLRPHRPATFCILYENQRPPPNGDHQAYGLAVTTRHTYAGLNGRTSWSAPVRQSSFNETGVAAPLAQPISCTLHQQIEGTDKSSAKAR